MAATLNRPSHEIAATFSIGNQPQLATSQRNAARNALAGSRPSLPMERKVSRRQTNPSDRQDDADEDRRRPPPEPGALRPGVVRVAGAWSGLAQQRPDPINRGLGGPHPVVHAVPFVGLREHVDLVDLADRAPRVVLDDELGVGQGA